LRSDFRGPGTFLFAAVSSLGAGHVSLLFNGYRGLSPRSLYYSVHPGCGTPSLLSNGYRGLSPRSLRHSVHHGCGTHQPPVQWIPRAFSQVSSLQCPSWVWDMPASYPMDTVGFLPGLFITVSILGVGHASLLSKGYRGLSPRPLYYSVRPGCGTRQPPIQWVQWAFSQVSSPQCPSWVWDTPASYSVDTGGYFRGINRPGRESDYGPPSSAKVSYQ
jgi:hypothetical protein